MRLSKAAFLLLFAVSAGAATPAKPPAYHLSLVAQPAATWPALSRFGTIDLDVYPGGVRAETMWLNGFSRVGSDAITVINPVARMYTDVPIHEFPALVAKLTGQTTGGTVTPNAPTMAAPIDGVVNGLKARRYRLVYGADAWIDIWTTTAVPENAQLKRIVQEFVRGAAPGTAEMMNRIPGVPLYVELNFSHYRKLPVVQFKNFTMDNKGEKDALNVGSYMLKAPLLDAIWK